MFAPELAVSRQSCFLGDLREIVVPPHLLQTHLFQPRKGPIAKTESLFSHQLAVPAAFHPKKGRIAKGKSQVSHQLPVLTACHTKKGWLAQAKGQFSQQLPVQTG
jgi:hypothetical protein